MADLVSVLSGVDVAAFWARAKGTKDGCWLFASVSSTGYGQFYVGRKPFKAHRVAWVLTYGAVPAGVMVCHRCDVRNCVNPAHLFLGTAKDNTRDSVAKGRWIPRGRSLARFDVTAAVEEFQRGGVTVCELGHKYGTAPANLRKHLRRRGVVTHG